jgi:pilus assembly protein CpaF
MENVSINFGPLLPLLNDGTVSEIMVNRFDRIFVERSGKLALSPIKFAQESQIVDLVHQIAKACGREINPSLPFLDGYLADGSRVNICLPPMAPQGATLTVRKFRKQPFKIESLIAGGSLSEKAAYFIHAAVIARLNIVVSGGTGTGKTTFLNALSSVIPESERIISIEDISELNLQHENWIRLEAVHRPGKESITARDCLVNALRMRPDRILVGECRRDETFEMLQAMNTGHDGSMTTIHANSSRDCLARLESLILTGGIDLPVAAIRKQIASAVHFIVQLKRLRNGTRVVQEIIELTGMEQTTITTQTLFTRERKKESSAGTSPVGADPLLSIGLLTHFNERFGDAGIQFPPNFFDPKSNVKYHSEG